MNVLLKLIEVCAIKSGTDITRHLHPGLSRNASQLSHAPLDYILSHCADALRGTDHSSELSLHGLQ